jgi:CRP/FNR family transcriptional regulator, cyclic AMP receptor protein
MLAMLAQVEFLRPLPPDRLAELAARGRPRTFPAGSRLMRQGAVGDRLHVVVRGNVQVERSHPHLIGPVVLAEIGPGEVVGELGVLDGEPCKDTVRAVEDSETIELEAGALASTLLRFPEVAASLLPSLSRRLRNADELAEQARRRGWSQVRIGPGGDDGAECG